MNVHPAPQFAVSGRLSEPDLFAVLISAGFSADVARWVESHLDAGPYTHFTITLTQRDSRSVLIINTFLLETWTNSETGKTGESPHGSYEEFFIGPDGKVLDSALDKIDGDGSSSFSFTSNVTYYGG